MASRALRRWAAALLLPAAAAQTPADPAEARALLARTSAAAIDCQVSAVQPFLNFALRMQSGYLFRLPLNAYAGPGHRLTVLTAITAKGSDQPAYLIDRLPLPPALRGDANGAGTGTYFLGEGSYRVDWLLVDEAGRACRKQWFVDAGAGRGVKPSMAPGTVAALQSLRPAPAPGNSRARRITILLDAAPFAIPPNGAPDPSALESLTLAERARLGSLGPPLPAGSGLPVAVTGTTLHPGDQVILLGELSGLLERLPAAAFRLVVFNLDQQKELYRNDNFAPASLGEVAGTLNQLQLAKVEYRVLQNRTGHIDLLAGLINRELRARPLADAVIFLGPRERFHDKFPGSLLLRHGAAPRFYFLACQLPGPPPGGPSLSRLDASYGGVDLGDLVNTQRETSSPVAASQPGGMPDTLSRAIAKVKGKTITIQTPRDFAKAVEGIAHAAR